MELTDSIIIRELNGEEAIDEQYEVLKYKDGRVYVVYQYIDNVQNGWETEYFSNDKISSKAFYKDGMKFGSAFYFYKNGDPEIYNCYDFDGKNRRVKYYDSSGNVTQDEGLLIVQTQHYNANEDLKYRVFDTLKFEAIISTPFNEIVRVDIVYDNKDTLKDVEIKYNLVGYVKELKSPGFYSLITIVKSRDTISNKEYNAVDTFNFQVY